MQLYITVFIYKVSIFLFVAAFTVCASEQSYFPGGTILFPYVQTRFCVRNSSLSALGSSGKYTCDEAGLYLISGFIMTKTTGYVFLYLKKNGYIIGRIYFSVTTNGNSYQTSTFLVLQYLNKHDTIHLQTAMPMMVYGNTYSCISFLQLTN